MTQYLKIHPDNPQQRLLTQVSSVLREGGVIVYPTDSSYALACHLEDKQAVERICQIRQLDKRHDMTLVCRDLAEISNYAKVGNSAFRLIKSLTPGPYTFLLKASRDVPKRLQHAQKKTIGLRVPANQIALELLSVFGEPILSSSLILPGGTVPLSDPEEIEEKIGNRVELVIDGGAGGIEPTSVLNMVNEEVDVVREGLGDVSWLL